MKKIIFIFSLVLIFASCSNKIVPDNYYAMNPIKSLPGITVTTVRWDGINFGRTTADYRAMVEKQFPDCVGIYVDSRSPKTFYVFVQSKEDK